MPIPNLPAGHVEYGRRGGDFYANATSVTKADGTGSVVAFTLAANQAFTVWLDDTLGGGQVTDLRSYQGTTTATPSTDPFGNVVFGAPDGLGTLYVSTDNGTTRAPVDPTRLAMQARALTASRFSDAASVEAMLAQTGLTRGAITAVGYDAATGYPGDLYMLIGADPSQLASWRLFRPATEAGVIDPADFDITYL